MAMRKMRKGGTKVKPVKIAGAKPFAKGPKKSEPDDRPRAMTPAKHMPKQQAKAKARKNLMRRLGSRGI